MLLPFNEDDRTWPLSAQLLGSCTFVASRGKRIHFISRAFHGFLEAHLLHAACLSCFFSFIL